MKKFYSQNDEDGVILNLLEQAAIGHGTFLDIGAWDGKTYSNTLRLVELGWGGVCVEPSPTAFIGLMKTHQANPDVVLVNSAISSGEKWLEFYDSNGDAVSSASTEHVARWSVGGGVKFTKLTLRAVSTQELFTKFGTSFDFINLDVESLNWELFQAFPWADLSRLKIICVEHDRHIKEMTDIAVRHGFKPVSENAENLIFSRLP